MTEDLQILCIATKNPFPPVDGGRLVLAETLRCLHRRGVSITLIVPASREEPERAQRELPCRLIEVASHSVGKVAALLKSFLGGPPYALARHHHPMIEHRVSDLLLAEQFDLVWVEQLQAAGNAFDHDRPVILRQQNVESALWRQWSTTSGFPMRNLAERESLRLAAFEGQAIRNSALTLTLSYGDAEELSEISDSPGKVEFLAPAFPAELEPGEPVEGHPALVISGSRGWWPNELGLRWFLDEIWPSLSRDSPGSLLHLYGLGRSDRDARQVWHAPPELSRSAFPANGILIVPLLHGSGIRIKILEAWARGIPVVATPEAAAGLPAKDGDNLLLASTATDFSRAVRSLESSSRRQEIVDAGRATLRRHHDPDIVSEELLKRLRSCLPDRRSSA